MIHSHLVSLTNTLLDTHASSAQHKRALDNFVSLCASVCHISPNPSFDAFAQDHYIGHGLAINPEAAAQCVKDYRRSVVFIRGVYDAIQQQLSHTSKQPINILYAGCGPYATQLLPLLCLLNPERLHITLLDVHQSSLDSVKTLIKTFGLNEFSIQFVNEDATQYQHPIPANLIISEVMQKALEQEPQLPVTLNLAPQLAANGIFIPEQINIELMGAHLEQEKKAFDDIGFIDTDYQLHSKRRIMISTLLSLTPNAVASLKHLIKINPTTQSHSITLDEIVLPKRIHQFSDLALFTQINVFKQHKLTEYECDLTLPAKVDVQSFQPLQRLEVKYTLGVYPKFEFIPF